MAEAHRQHSTVTREARLVEYIEGPAPAEDSSIPLEAVVPARGRIGPGAAVAAIAGASFDLPAPATTGAVSLEETLARRRSIRGFTGDLLTAGELSQLLWAAQGITARPDARTSPSAGGIHPLELYTVTCAGCHHYRPAGHALELLSDRELRPSLAQAAYGDRAITEAAVVVVIAAVLARTRARYGKRAGRYVALEAGHVAQNLLLQAVALDLAAVPIGAFDDDVVRRVMGAEAGHEPLYLVAVGHPRSRVL